MLGRLALVLVLLWGAHATTPVWWSQQAMEYQRLLAFDLPLEALTWAYSPAAYDYYRGYFYVPPNNGSFYHRPLDSELHTLDSLTQQLENGFRWLGFDVRWIPEMAAESGNADDRLFICYTDGNVFQRCFVSGSPEERARCQLQGIRNHGADTGCFAGYDRNLRENLLEVVAWLNQSANANDFAIVDLKWHLTALDDEVAALAQLEATLRDLTGTPRCLCGARSALYTPADKGAATSFPSLRTLTALGKRLLVVCDQPGCSGSSLVFNPSLDSAGMPYAAQAVSGFNTSMCASDAWGPTPLPANDFIKFWEDRVYRALMHGAPPPVPFPPSGTWSADQLVARRAMFCGFSVGLSDASYLNLQQTIWSWGFAQPQQPVLNPPTQACARIDPRTFLWDVANCAGSLYPYACRNNADVLDWNVTNARGPGNGAPSCPPGYSYVAPENGRQMGALAFAMQVRAAQPGNAAEHAWVNSPPSAATLPIPVPPPRRNDTLQSPYLTYPGIEPRPRLPISNETGGPGPRFCGLAADTDVFACDWETYGNNVVDRNVGFIAFAGIGLAISCIFGLVITLCCCKCIFVRKSKVDRFEDGDDSDDDKGRKRDKFRWFLIAPFIIVLIGAIPVFVGNAELTTTFNDSAEYLRDQRDGLIALQATIRETIFALPATAIDPTIRADLDRRLNAGVEDLRVNMNNFLDIIDNSALVRALVTWTITVGMLVACLFGGIFLFKRAPKWLLLLLVVINFFVFLTILDFTVHSSLKIASDDICREIYRPNGMFQLWQRQALIGFARLQDITEASFRTLTVQGCTGLEVMCRLPYQACGNYPCHLGNIISDVANITVVDQGGVLRTLEQCGGNGTDACTNLALASSAAAYLNTRDLIQQYFDVEEQIYEFFNGLSGEKGQADLNRILCGKLDDDLQYVYGGCAVLLVGELLEMGLLFFFGY